MVFKVEDSASFLRKHGSREKMDSLIQSHQRIYSYNQRQKCFLSPVTTSISNDIPNKMYYYVIVF